MGRQSALPAARPRPLYYTLAPPGLARALLFPLNIWALEIVEGYALIYLYGYNPAWEYRGDDALFHGTIKLSYWRYWLPMGLVLEYLLWNSFVQWTTLAALTIGAWTGGVL